MVAVGHSMGGQAVNLLAVRHPELVRSVVALDPAHGAHGAEVDGIPGDWPPTGSEEPALPRTSSQGPSPHRPRPGCVPPISAPCSAPRTMSSPRRTPACTRNRTPSASARTVRRICADACGRP
ncbi:alpha/beta fold hydrolase [Streptomyces sp. NBC_00582]|uniref:alpha/beta fold hydrolase n=1 Tax=Streptomyces sp. NBC_00582 TaxID=2975783 RepID=UPI003FCCA342|nr:alpha/beta hydrolase [Streptomyces sp. NBC_00582]